MNEVNEIKGSNETQKGRFLILIFMLVAAHFFTVVKLIEARHDLRRAVELKDSASYMAIQAAYSEGMAEGQSNEVDQ